MSGGDIALSDSEFEKIKSLIYDYAGIALSEAKRTLIVSRLSKIVHALELGTFAKYAQMLETRATGAQKQEFVNALTTNLTRFYREDHHFDHLEKYVGDLMRAPRSSQSGQKLRIWSAGCSTGPEPYTIGMCLLAKYPQLKNWDFRILATDLDTAVLAKAARGIYPKNDLNGLSAHRARVFEDVGDDEIRVPDAVRRLVSFKPLNLMQDWPLKNKFDAIFCRNVAIYFDRPTQQRLFSRFDDFLVDDGFLYIGHSENIPSGTGHFSLQGKTIYQKSVNADKKAAS